MGIFLFDFGNLANNYTIHFSMSTRILFRRLSSKLPNYQIKMTAEFSRSTVMCFD